MENIVLIACFRAVLSSSDRRLGKQQTAAQHAFAPYRIQVSFIARAVVRNNLERKSSQENF